MSGPKTGRPPWPRSASAPLVSPLQPSVVYTSEGPDALDAIYGQGSGYTYAREGHPNADVTAGMIDRLEGAEGGILTGSGMAAVTAALLAVARAGDHVVGSDQLYGRSLRLLNETLPGLGIETSLLETGDAARVAAALRENTCAVLIETVSNPTIRIPDIAGIAALCRARGLRLLVDNTFATPRAFRPFEHGADLVIHSVTKLLSGHSDTTLGYVAAREAEVRERIVTLAVTMGLTPSPFDAWLAERGLLTFALRYDRAEANAAELAGALAGHGGVERVLYPQSPDHPDRARAVALLGNRGSHMVSFDIGGGRARAERFIRELSAIPFAPTLGDVTTTISHPATSSHRGLTAEAREAHGMGEGFFRVSVGCEEAGAVAPVFLAALNRLRSG
ncbi:trans-sulfuration enzyme family protein [Ovoidimarina sediminis]|uniref:trans-sulfuration enzyme family protein n=1 Tax=Ovoidimarina sediminis TaxID=3079856 RepID=UPI00290781A1|nr:aminotransferase class I/II-fold pyridoxal phosphate-dependent enzyme [Rhodophyticola sp. MJ-SS7]MDU8941926.1 aminotransferase class I/II-fold pyridoxal phosphate-dependent enzyme [Rhodophyticola sp. MJ-SS7]